MLDTPDFLIWADTETDIAANPRDGHLLEIAVIITRADLEPIAEPFHAVVKYEATEVAEMYTNANDFVRQMHSTTGLWGRLEEGTPLAQVETELLAYIKAVCPDAGVGQLAGNTIRHDANFIEEYLPSVWAHLDYHLIDVSSIASLVRWQFGHRVSKTSDHTALRDIQESIEQLRALWFPMVAAAKQVNVEFSAGTPEAMRDFMRHREDSLPRVPARHTSRSQATA